MGPLAASPTVSMCRVGMIGLLPGTSIMTSWWVKQWEELLHFRMVLVLGRMTIDRINNCITVVTVWLHIESKRCRLPFLIGNYLIA
jgi:hypothetical protein